MSEKILNFESGQTGIDQEIALDQSQPELELAKTVKYMERMHASEIFSTPKHSKEFLDSLDYSDFKKWLSFVNGVERGIPKLERGKVGDSKVLSEGALTGTEVEYKPPHKDYRDKLLQIAFKKAQSIEDPEIAAFNFGVFY